MHTHIPLSFPMFDLFVYSIGTGFIVSSVVLGCNIHADVCLTVPLEFLLQTTKTRSRRLVEKINSTRLNKRRFLDFFYQVSLQAWLILRLTSVIKDQVFLHNHAQSCPIDSKTDLHCSPRMTASHS